MRKYLSGLLFAALLAVPGLASAQVPYGFPARNPCASALSPKSSAAINIGSATTSQLIAAPTAPSTFSGATQQIWVCTWVFSLTGTSPTYQFVNGTGTNCGTGQANLTAVIPSISATAPNVAPQEQGTVLVVPPGQALCATIGGTGPSAQGYITYVVQ